MAGLCSPAVCWKTCEQTVCMVYLCSPAVLFQTALGETCAQMVCMAHLHSAAVCFPYAAIGPSDMESGRPGFEPRFPHEAFSWSSHTSDLLCAPAAALSCAWLYKGGNGTGGPSVNVLWLGEIASLICSFCLSVLICTIAWADLSQRYTSMLLGC